jgi:hypothetical protein
MKTVKILMPVAALFISAIAFGQKSNGQQKRSTKTQESSVSKKYEARTNGAVNANANANTNAQQNANENSVLNGTTTYAGKKYKTKDKTYYTSKKKYGIRKKTQ